MLIKALHKDLQDIGIPNWPQYGTHSFRRGGCQYRLRVLGWSADMIAAWGGWDQAHAITMFRYFYSPNDRHAEVMFYDRTLPVDVGSKRARRD